MSPTSISATELSNALQSKHPPVVFDVRKKPAFEKDPGTLPGATWQNHEDVHIWAENIKPGNPLVVYCVHGHEVSQNACSTLCDMGFEATFLEGGIDGWKQAGLAITNSSE